MVLRTTFILALVAAVVAAAGVRGRAQPARGDGVVLIVHPSNRIATVDRAFLRDAYMRKLVTWSGGETIRPVGLPRPLAVRDRFTRDVLRKTPAQLRSYWTRQIFTGTGVPPVERASEASVVAYVLANRGAIAYLPEGSDPRGAKVIRLR